MALPALDCGSLLPLSPAQPAVRDVLWKTDASECTPGMDSPKCLDPPRAENILARSIFQGVAKFPLETVAEGQPAAPSKTY